MPLPECFRALNNTVRETYLIPGVEYPRVTGKMRRKQQKQMMLFDLENDPYETKDVTEDNPDIVNLLLKKMADYYVNIQHIYNSENSLIECGQISNSISG